MAEHLYVDISNESDDFKIKLLPTSQATTIAFNCRNMIIRCNYYNGLTTKYVSLKCSPECNIDKMSRNLMIFHQMH